MPDALTDEDVGLAGELSDTDVGLGGAPPGKDNVTISPYEQARMAGPMEPMGVFGPAHPEEAAAISLPALGKSAVSGALQGIGQVGGDIFRETLREYGIGPENIQWPEGTPLPLPGGTPGFGQVPATITAPESFMAGAEQRAGELAHEFTSPEQLSTLALAPLKPVQVLFAGQAALSIPESIEEIEQAKGPREIGAAVTGGLANLGIAAGLGKELILPRHGGAGLGERIADASRIKTPTEVHGDVRAQPEQGLREVPVQEGGPGVQPQAEAVAKATQVPLEPDAYEAAEREAIAHAERLGANVEVLEDLPSDPNSPFARQIAWADKTGIKINRVELQKWLADIPPEQHQAAIESLIGEEHIHTNVTDTDASSYWKNLTAAEKALVRRRYTGKWRGLPQFNEVQMGHEAIRGRIQQLTRMTPREVAEAVGREKWTVQSIYALEKTIARIREGLGTKASWAQKSILDRVQQNLDLARGIIEPSSGPSAFRKRTDDELADSVKVFRESLKNEKMGVGGGTNRAQTAGLGSKSVADLDALAQMRLDQHEKGKSAKNMDEKMVAMFSSQYPREAIETATNSGSAVEEEWAKRGKPLGPRPLDWRQHPEVANWLQEHGPALGIVLPEALRESEYMGYLGLREGEKPAAYRKPGSEDEPGTEDRQTRRDYTFEKAFYSILEAEAYRDELSRKNPNMRYEVFLEGSRYSVESSIPKGPGGKAPDVLSPSAFRKPKSGKPGEQPEMFPGITAKGVPGAENVPRDNLTPVADVEPLLNAIQNLPVRESQSFLGEILSQLSREIRERVAQKPSAESGATPQEQLQELRSLLSESGEARQEALRTLWKYGQSDAPPELRQAVTRAMAVSGLPSAPAPTAHPSAAELGALQSLPAIALDDQAARHLAESARPSFKEFADWAARNAGRIKPDQLRDLWSDQVWLQLMTATPERLAQIRKSLDLESKVGARNIAGPPQPGRPEESVEGTALTRERTRKAIVAAQKYRNNVIGAIASKLINESLPRTKALDRSTITIDDIDFGNDRSKEGAYREIREEEADNPDALRRIVTDSARPSRREPVSHTRRLLALLDKRTGAVELVDAYPHGRSGVMVYEPTGGTGIRGKPHRPIASVLRNYRPFASPLLDEPVQNFHQRFADLSEYNDKIGSEASAREKVVEWAWGGEEEVSPEQAPYGMRPEDVEAEVEGTPGVKGGMFAGGPGKPEMEAIVGTVRGSLERAQFMPLMPSEALAVLDHVLDEVGKIDNHADMVDALQRLVDRANKAKAETYRPTGKRSFRELKAIPPVEGETIQTPTGALTFPLPRGLRGRDFQVVSALKKAADHIMEKYKEADLTPTQAMSQALDEFYEILTKNKGSEDYIQQALGRFTEPARETRGLPATVVPGAPATAAGVSRELTMRQRRPPTAVAGAEPGVAPAATEGVPGPYKPPLMLPPQAQAAVEAKAVQEQPFQPATPAWTDIERVAKPAGGPAKIYADIVHQTAPGFVMPERFLFGPKVDPSPAAFRKIMRRGQEEVSRDRREVSALLLRREAKEGIAAGWDAKHNKAVILGDQAEHEVRTYANQSPQHPNGDPEILRAAPAVIAAKFDQANLRNLVQLAETGIVHAENLMRSPQPWKWRNARAWLRASQDLKASAEYAQNHWNSAFLQDTANAMVNELDKQYAREVASGKQLRYKADYYPGRYDGAFWNDTQISFPGIGRLSILGRNWRFPKTFDNMWTAIANPDGPYVPATLDGASVVGHRVRQGMESVNRKLWQESLFNIRDPFSQTEIARRPVLREGQSHIPGSDSKDFELVQFGQQLIGIRKSFVPLVRQLINPSWFQDHLAGRAAVEWSQRLKHTLLAADFFHLFRVGYYGGATMRLKAGMRGGLAAIEYSDDALSRAVQNGVVSPQDAAWSREMVPVNTGAGRTIQMSRRQILEEGVTKGLNIGRLQDAIYKDLVANVPWLGTYNKWLFDKVTRGVMSEAFVTNFEQLNKANPNVDARRMLRDVVKDTNTFFSSLGKQGWIKSSTFQDLARTVFLAPQWVEGLIRKEAGLYSRTGAAALNLAGFDVGRQRAGLPKFGMIGKGMGTGLATMFVLTQLMNLFTRKKPTWENAEEGHKWDAYLPIGKGVWFSPLSVFNELTHDLIRYFYTKPKAWDAVQQIGENKLSPYARAALVLWNGTTPTGQRITTTPRVFAEAGKALLPIPITFGRVGQAVGHAVAPGIVRPPPPGSVERQLMATMGMKTEIAQTPSQQIYRMAQDFMRKSGLKKETGWMEVPTVEASYSKLRTSLAQDDEKGFKVNLQELRKTHSDTDIYKAMKKWAYAPFTGGKHAEVQFLNTLTKEEMEAYNKAVTDKMDVMEKFMEFLSRTD